jgi:DNA polymerase-3 subunit delta
MAKQQELSCDDILRQLKEKRYAPVYYLMGEEDYYIDLIADYITENVLTETEKEFNQMVFYGNDVDMATVISAAKRYPMMSDRQVVVVKEAQAVSNAGELIYYLKKPLESTILVFCHKHGAIDRRSNKQLIAELEKVGVVFESKRLKDTQLPAFISSYLKRKSVDIEPKAAAMMADYVGTDLSRLTGELDKLIITLPTGGRRITPEQIETNIGISKDYNNFELKNALIEKDVLKANKIIAYMNDNPKANPIQATLAILFSYFSNLMLAYYAPDKSEQGVASWLELRSSWTAREYITGMRRYSGMKTMSIIGYIRNADAMSKGVDSGGMTDGEIMRELIFKILH